MISNLNQLLEYFHVIFRICETFHDTMALNLWVSVVEVRLYILGAYIHSHIKLFPFPPEKCRIYIVLIEIVILKS